MNNCQNNLSTKDLADVLNDPIKLIVKEANSQNLQIFTIIDIQYVLNKEFKSINKKFFLEIHLKVMK